MELYKLRMFEQAVETNIKFFFPFYLTLKTLHKMHKGGTRKYFILHFITVNKILNLEFKVACTIFVFFIVTFICCCNISTSGSAVRIFEIGLVISVDIYCMVLDVTMHYNVGGKRGRGNCAPHSSVRISLNHCSPLTHFHK